MRSVDDNFFCRSYSLVLVTIWSITASLKNGEKQFLDSYKTVEHWVQIVQWMLWLVEEYPMLKGRLLQ